MAADILLAFFTANEPHADGDDVICFRKDAVNLLIRQCMLGLLSLFLSVFVYKFSRTFLKLAVVGLFVAFFVFVVPAEWVAETQRRMHWEL